MANLPLVRMVLQVGSLLMVVLQATMPQDNRGLITVEPHLASSGASRLMHLQVTSMINTASTKTTNTEVRQTRLNINKMHNTRHTKPAREETTDRQHLLTEALVIHNHNNSTVSTAERMNKEVSTCNMAEGRDQQQQQQHLTVDTEHKAATMDRRLLPQRGDRLG
jgi:hypothetical protein